MPSYSIPYGKTNLNFEIPADRPVEIIAPPLVLGAPDPAALVAAALDAPLGGRRLADFGPLTSAAVAINDKTRPVPHALLLPPLLARLEAAGLRPEQITLYIAAGTHPPMPPEEFGMVVPPEILARYPVVCHDAADTANLVNLGQTPRGTPVWVNRGYAAADLRLVVGNIEPHQFQGFSGGVKSAAVGLAGEATINANHTMMMDPASALGEYEDNPARQDVEQIGERIGIHFALNAILNHKKEIVHVVAGAPRLVMQAGIPLSRQVCQVSVAAPYRLVIASPGGHPKDINLYQAQKGLAHARLVTQPGGTVILAAACPEGTGSQHYEDWMKDKTSLDQVFESFRREGYRIGPHKAFQLARDAAQVQVHFLSEMDPAFVRSLLLDPIADLQQALDACLAGLPPGEPVGVLPRAAATIPYIQKG